MKALTISEPWAWATVDASLINDRWKCVENRRETFPRFTGRLLIHSGKSRTYVPAWPDCQAVIRRALGRTSPAFAELAGRGLIGVAEVCATVPISELARPAPWMAEHGLDHGRLKLWAEGPKCLCFAWVAPFDEPIPYRGQEGLFNVPDAVVEDAVELAIERAGIRQFGGG